MLCMTLTFCSSCVRIHGYCYQESQYFNVLDHAIFVSPQLSLKTEVVAINSVPLNLYFIELLNLKNSLRIFNGIIFLASFVSVAHLIRTIALSPANFLTLIKNIWTNCLELDNSQTMITHVIQGYIPCLGFFSAFLQLQGKPIFLKFASFFAHVFVSSLCSPGQTLFARNVRFLVENFHFFVAFPDFLE